MADFEIDLTWWFSEPPPPPPPVYPSDLTSIDYLDLLYSAPGTGATLENPSFEIADGDVEALPESWSVVVESTAIDVARGLGVWWTSERFDYGWQDNQDAIEVFASGDLSFAQFGSHLRVYENFEAEWRGNEGWLDELPTGASFALFGSAEERAEAFDQEWPDRHVVADTVSTFPSAYVTLGNVPEFVARVNAIKAAFNSHISSGVYHTAPDTENAITSPDATDIGTAVDLVTEAWPKGWAHMLDSVEEWHRPDTVRPLRELGGWPTAEPTEMDRLINDFGLCLLLHFQWASNAGPGVFGAFDSYYPAGSDPFAWIDAAIFGVDEWVEAVERFDHEWKHNEDAIEAFAPEDLEAAAFTTNGAPEAFEGFEIGITVPVPTSPATAGAAVATGTTNRLRVAFSGDLVGDLGVEAQLGTSPNWVEWGRVTTVPTAIDFDAGFKAVRVYCHAYTSGAPAAAVRWRPLDE